MLEVAICFKLLARRFDDDGFVNSFFVRDHKMDSHIVNS